MNCKNTVILGIFHGLMFFMPDYKSNKTINLQSIK